jgi:hypothetical protein
VGKGLDSITRSCAIQKNFYREVAKARRNAEENETCGTLPLPNQKMYFFVRKFGIEPRIARMKRMGNSLIRVHPRNQRFIRLLGCSRAVRAWCSVH